MMLRGLVLLGLLSVGSPRALDLQCKCGPSDACWPSAETWNGFNKTLNGKLIRNGAVALPCYSGAELDVRACEAVNTGWKSPIFQAQHPIGYDYPLNLSCPPVQLGAVAAKGNCALGNSPVYAVNVTSVDDISRSLAFAQENNLRVVVKSTGHDFLQRSTGYGSLSIWLRHLRNGFTFHDVNPELDTCPDSGWSGSTLTVSGSYPWSDIYPIAREKGVIVVGGNNAGPCSTGGWTQGGGHSPVTRHFGLGADQVLSASVVLASGEVVRASPCENADLFFAIRGGGPGTYGVVTELNVKTYRDNRTVSVATVNMGSPAGEQPTGRFLDAVAAVYESMPDLSKRGFSGYGAWLAHLPAPGSGPKNYSNVYQQSFMFIGGGGSSGESQAAVAARELFRPFEEMLAAFGNPEVGLDVSTIWSTYADYGSYFASKTDTNLPVGSVSALGSRLLGGEELVANRTRLRAAIEALAGVPGRPVAHTLVHHGLQAKGGEEKRASPSSGSAVQPGWYRSVVLDIFELQMSGFDVATNAGAFAYLRGVAEPAARGLSPDTGTYMNEADWGSARWKEDFYGEHWARLSAVKQSLDPGGLFYCPTCVGSEQWRARGDGVLCKA